MHEELPMNGVQHIPVLADAVLELLDPQPGQIVVDATTGVGGHARLLAQKVGRESGRLICLDRDPEMLAIAQRQGPGRVGNVTFVHGNFEDLPEILQKLHVETRRCHSRGSWVLLRSNGQSAAGTEFSAGWAARHAARSHPGRTGQRHGTAFA